jgi:hypothetical protein
VVQYARLVVAIRAIFSINQLCLVLYLEGISINRRDPPQCMHCTGLQRRKRAPASMEETTWSTYGGQH